MNLEKRKLKPLSKNGGERRVDHKETAKALKEGRTSLGIEFGSTRIKAILIDEEFQPIAQGAYEWEKFSPGWNMDVQLN
ncbi:hypothetical protein BsIDN1_46500 [Bacillus safensis]|uniref:Carbohydrate kinase FGGY N-terminal domain-containing protein n=1 Tax=Bacillus safensis TaxID=561879 RepID=A0A5S9MEJ6_BACIA|nr:hypothetical protein BsIDN1_46500 [Bacillus safensis]